MSTLEVIHLRLAGEDPETLASRIRDAVEPFSGRRKIVIYRHKRVETDLVIHLHLGDDDGDHRGSELGVQLASMLRHHGIVDHSVWVQALEDR